MAYFKSDLMPDFLHALAFFNSPLEVQEINTQQIKKKKRNTYKQRKLDWGKILVYYQQTRTEIDLIYFSDFHGSLQENLTVTRNKYFMTIRRGTFKIRVIPTLASLNHLIVDT